MTARCDSFPTAEYYCPIVVVAVVVCATAEAAVVVLAPMSTISPARELRSLLGPAVVAAQPNRRGINAHRMSGHTSLALCG